MADEATEQAAEETQQASVETTTEGSQPETQTQDSNANSTEQAGENQEGSNTENASTGDQKQSENQDSKKDSKPVSRRSAAYRINQLVEENKTLKKQLGKPAQEQDDWEAPPQEDDKPDLQTLIDAAVEKRLNPIVSESSKAADDAELSELFSGRAEERSRYESRIRSLWNLSQYKDVAASDLLNMLRGSEMDQTITQAQQKAVEEFKKAKKEARDSSTSGTNTSNRTGNSGKSVADMTDEELKAHNERVKAGLA